MEHIPFTPQHAQYEAQQHQHPLARILNKEGDQYLYNLLTRATMLIRWFHRHKRSVRWKPVFSIKYNGHKFDGQILGSSLPDFNPDHESIVCTWTRHSWHKEKLKFEFPWKSWGLDPQSQNWSSDVGLLPGHEMKWICTYDSGHSHGKSSINLTLKCVDENDPEKWLASRVVVQKYSRASIEIPAQTVASKQQLVELVSVTLAVAD